MAHSENVALDADYSSLTLVPHHPPVPTSHNLPNFEPKETITIHMIKTYECETKKINK